MISSGVANELRGMRGGQLGQGGQGDHGRDPNNKNEQIKNDSRGALVARPARPRRRIRVLLPAQRLCPKLRAQHSLAEILHRNRFSAGFRIPLTTDFPACTRYVHVPRDNNMRVPPVFRAPYARRQARITARDTWGLGKAGLPGSSPSCQPMRRIAKPVGMTSTRPR